LFEGKMAGAAGAPASLAIKEPEQIVIDKSHVDYACALVREQFKPADTRRDPAVKFEDSRCPSMYMVYIIWDKPRPPGTKGTGYSAGHIIHLTATHYRREYRAIGYGYSEGLAQAIRMAVGNLDPHFAAMPQEELHLSTCKVILLHQVQRVVDPDTWQPANHGLVLRVDNPNYDPQQEGSVDYVAKIFLKEVAISQRWSFNKTLSALMDEEGLPSDPDTVCDSTFRRTSLLLRIIKCCALTQVLHLMHEGTAATHAEIVPQRYLGGEEQP
jgi:hypothetical protein